MGRLSTGKPGAVVGDRGWGEVSFQPIQEEDLPMLLTWLQQPHVRAWWDDGDDTLAKVRNHYLQEPADETTDDLASGVHRFFIHLSQLHLSRPAGYIQCYEDLEYVHDQASIGIDLFLAEPRNLRRGLGTLVLREFVDFIWQQAQVEVLVVDPSPSNERAIGCYKKAGFRYQSTVKASDGELHYLMLLHRSNEKPNSQPGGVGQ